MIQDLNLGGLWRACMAVALVLLALACQRSHSVTPPPPATTPGTPLPQSVVVRLGSFGGSVTLVASAAGGWTLNDEAVRSGVTQVEGSNGLAYLLTQTGGMWAGEYLAGNPFRLRLGMSDEYRLLHLQESGDYHLDDEPVFVGRIVRANTSESLYELELAASGVWRANLISDSVIVPLGRTGGMATLTPTEDRMWTHMGEPFSSGDKITSRLNGFEYLLTLGPDGWFAEPLSMIVEAEVVGEVAPPLLLARLEDDTYLYGDTEVAHQDIVYRGASTYELRRSAADEWTAHVRTGDILVRLGTSSRYIILVLLQDGTYQFNGVDVMDGTVIRDPISGGYYILVVRDGIWHADEHSPPGGGTPTPGGGGTPNPGDGGSGTPNPDDGGSGTPDPGDGGATPPPEQPAPIWAPPLQVDTGGPILYDLPQFELITDAAEFYTSRALNTQVRAGVRDRDFQGQAVDYSGYSAGGYYETPTFADAVVQAIDFILDPIDAGTVTGADREDLIATFWPLVDARMDAVFGADQVTFVRGADVDADLTLLRAWKANMNTRASFLSVFSTQISAAVAADPAATGDAIFDATERTLTLASTENTRHGIYARTGTTAVEVAAGSGTAVLVPFAFSPLAFTPREDLPHRGTATYSGAVWAMDGDQNAYSGRIDLQAALGIDRVSGTISQFQSVAGGAWMHGGNAVEEIALPTITQSDFHVVDGSFSTTDGTATLSYAGSPTPATADVTSSAFSGQFVGDIGASPGPAIMGTWGIGDLLVGSFGTERSTIEPVVLPAVPSERYRLGGDSDNILRDPDTRLSFTDPANPDLFLGATRGESASFDVAFDLAALGDANIVDRVDPRPDAVGDGRPVASVRLGSSRFTNFGVWKLTHPAGSSIGTPGAVIDGGNYYDDDFANELYNDGTGFFAYSWLADSAAFPEGRDDEYFPVRVIAQYRGLSLMVSNAGEIRTGNYQLTVDWSELGEESIGGIRNAFIPTGTITARVGNLGYFVGGRELADVTFEHSFDSTGAALPCGLCFRAGGATANATFGFLDGGTITVSQASHNGQFVGNEGTDGPLAVFGSWSVDSQNLSIEGAFGADLIPEP